MGDFDNKYLKIRFNSNNNLSVKQELNDLVIVIRSLSHYSSKYYSQVLLDECLNKSAE